MPAFLVMDQIRGQLQDGVVIERGGQPFFGQFDAIAFDTREAELERIALGPHSLELGWSRAAAVAARPPAWR